MKLYRAVPITMFSPTIHSEAHPEDIYASNSFITINHKPATEHRNKNDLAEDIIGDGKYFFFFPEHAILLGNEIYHNHYLLKLIEYDLPEKIAFKLVGNGYYGSGNVGRAYPETLINYQDIPGSNFISTALSTNDKIQMLKKSLLETYCRIQTMADYQEFHGMDFETFFNTISQNNKFAFIGGDLFNQYLNDCSYLIATNNIISGCWTINTDFKSNVYYSSVNTELYNENIPYLSQNGLFLQTSEAAEYARIEFNVNGIMYNNIKKAKALLKQYHHDYPNH